MTLLWWDIWWRTCTAVRIFGLASDFSNLTNLMKPTKEKPFNRKLQKLQNFLKKSRSWPSWFSVQHPKPWLHCPSQSQMRKSYCPHESYQILRRFPQECLHNELPNTKYMIITTVHKAKTSFLYYFSVNYKMLPQQQWQFEHQKQH